MGEFVRFRPEHLAWWEEKFQALPEAVLVDYLRILRAVHRRYEGRRIKSPGLGYEWVFIDGEGRLRVEPVDWSRIHGLSHETFRNSPPDAYVSDLMGAFPNYRCGALVCGNVHGKIGWPFGPIVDDAVCVHPSHRSRHGVDHGFFSFPFECKGRFLRRTRLEPRTVAFIDDARWTAGSQGPEPAS